jgi:hypothetical protein
MRRRRDAAVSVEELERRQRRRGWVVGIGIIFGYLMLISTLYGTFLTHQVVASHNTELTQIKALSTQIAARQQDHSQTLHKIAALTEQLNAAKDVMATVMVIFESRYNAPAAGLFDVGGWIASLVCSALAIEEIVKNGWRTRKSMVIIAAVSMANFAGTFAGVAIASALTRH